MIALHSIRKGAEEKKETFKQYVLEGQDPSVNVVLMEDFAAVSCTLKLSSSTSYNLRFYFKLLPTRKIDVSPLIYLLYYIV